MRWWKKKRDENFDPFEEEFKRIMRMIDELMKDFFSGEFSETPVTYGFSIRIGPDGKPVIREFGNIRSEDEGIKVSDEIEPFVDVIEKNGEVDVIAELPGAEKSSIDVRVLGNRVVISAKGPEKKYRKEVVLGYEVEPVGKASFKNGVLQLKLRKK